MAEPSADTTVEALRAWSERAPALAPSRAAARRRQIRARQHLMMLDFGVLVLAGIVIAFETRAGLIDTAALPWAVSLPILSYLMLMAKAMHRPRVHPSLLDDTRGILASTAVAAMAITFVAVLLGDDPRVAEAAIAAWLTAFAMLCTARAGLRGAELIGWRNGGGRPTIIVGAGRIGHILAERIATTSGGLRPVAFLDEAPLPGFESDLPVLGSEALERFVRDHEVEHAIVAFSNESNESQLALMDVLSELGVSVSVVPRLFEGVRDQMEIDRVGGLPLVTMFAVPPTSWRFALKYAIDRLIAGTVLLLAAPAMIVTAIAVRVDLGRPIFYRQTRIGRDGGSFEMLKFRSMQDATSEQDSDEHSWKTLESAFEHGLGPGGVEGDGDRRTRFGAMIRRLSIDELPQLINVLKGDMSLVGPRPERPPIVERFERQFHRYNDRHRVKPGITGWAQVHGLRGRTSISDRVEWDNYYVENWTPWLDVKIVAMTLVALVRDDAE